MFLVLRSYGGLGNQIFQYFFCLNLQEKIKFKKVYSIHSTNYSHQFIHNESLKIYPKPPKLIKIISDLRLPMILSRLGIYKKGYIKIGDYVFLDSYFQEKKLYSSFSKNNIKKSLENIRSILGISQRDAEFENVYHLRLKDFFKNENDELNYLKSSLDIMIPGSFIITNRQDLFSSEDVIQKMEMKKLSLIDTEGFDAKEVIGKFSMYSNITTNNSTLALWAAILCNRNLILSVPDKPCRISQVFNRESEYSKLIKFQEIFLDL